jgi:phosphoglycolate phosphatase
MGLLETENLSKLIKYLLFDFDGTLADSKEVFISVFNQMATTYRFNKIDPGNIPALNAMPMKDRFSYLKVPLYKLPILTSKFLSLYQQNLPGIKLFDGIKELLSQLKERGYSVAVLSSNDKTNITRILADHQIDITDVYCSRSLFGKDRLIKKFLTHYKLQAPEVIYVGDEHRDAVACQKMGVQMIWVKWGYDDPDVNRPNPHHVAAKPKDILGILESM